jgi:hypothetical protein
MVRGFLVWTSLSLPVVSSHCPWPECVYFPIVLGLSVFIFIQWIQNSKWGGVTPSRACVLFFSWFFFKKVDLEGVLAVWFRVLSAIMIIIVLGWHLISSSSRHFWHFWHFSPGSRLFLIYSDVIKSHCPSSCLECVYFQLKINTCADGDGPSPPFSSQTHLGVPGGGWGSRKRAGTTVPVCEGHRRENRVWAHH